MLTTLLQEVQHASSSGLHILKDFMEAKVVDTVRLLLRLLPPVTLAQKSESSIPVILQGSLNYLFWRDQTMQIYGNFEGVPF